VKAHGTSARRASPVPGSRTGVVANTSSGFTYSQGVGPPFLIEPSGSVNKDNEAKPQVEIQIAKLDALQNGLALQPLAKQDFDFISALVDTRGDGSGDDDDGAGSASIIADDNGDFEVVG